MPEPFYQTRSQAWFDKRLLKRHAGVLHLWALGVGAVISGDFFGWNYGFAAGGFGGMLAALLIVTILYICLCTSIAEMTAALPHTGGAYSFARTAMGRWAGYITGLAENMEYIFTPATIVVGVGGYLTAIAGTNARWTPLWWLACYVVFVALNIWGVALSFRVSVAVTICALIVLAIFYAGAIPLFDLHRWAIPEGAWRHGAGTSVFRALPFALWVYLGIEQLPLAAEESHNPRRDLPRGILWALGTLILCSLLTPVLSGGIPPGSRKVGESSEPLFLGFQAIFGSGIRTKLLALFACTGLFASFHAIIFAYGRQIYSLARAGYFPEWLSVTHGVRKTPHRALILGGLVGYASALAIWFAGQSSRVGAVLLNMAVFGAVIAYVLQMVSFVVLRLRFPRITRPFVNRLGIPGAVVAAVLSVLTLAALFVDPDYRLGAWGATVWAIVGVLCFALRARKGLILSPEEEFAVRHSLEARRTGTRA